MTSGNAPAQYGSASFVEPAPYGYLYLGLRVDPPGRTPFVRRSAKRDAVLRDCGTLADRLAELPEVVAATVYRAVLIPPVRESPRFDVLMLIETTTPEALGPVEVAAQFDGLGVDFVMRANNIRRIGDVDALPRTGTFLFNHFSAADAERALPVWENVTGWFTDKAGVRDSALLQPIEADGYVFVNHVRLPCGPLRFMLRFGKPSFRKYVSANLNANDIGTAPVICQAVRPGSAT